jgi:hypothetical protein
VDTTAFTFNSGGMAVGLLSLHAASSASATAAVAW